MRASRQSRFSGCSRHFPSFSEGLSLRDRRWFRTAAFLRVFPFLFGGTFIEGDAVRTGCTPDYHFPSFSEGLSLRATQSAHEAHSMRFPFLFGGTFIEGYVQHERLEHLRAFPFLFGGTFIEGQLVYGLHRRGIISLPFRRDFH